MIDVPNPQAQAQAPIAVGFDSAAEACRPVGGVCALARVLRELQRAGAVGARVILSEEGELTRECREDIARVAPGLGYSVTPRAVAESSMSAQPVVQVRGRFLIDAAALRPLLDGTVRELRWQGETIASRPGAGLQHELRRDEVIAMDSGRAAAWQLLLRTGKASDGPVSRWLNRPVSWRISALLLNLRAARPDHVTALAAALALIMFACFLFGDRNTVLVGAVLFHVASVIDGVDGEMARVTFRSSPRGAALDTWVDRASILLFLLGMTIAVGRFHGTAQALVGLWGFLAAAIGVLVFSRLLPPPHGFNALPAYLHQRFPRGVGRAATDTVATLIGRDVFSLVLPLLALIGPLYLVTWTFSAFATLWLIVILALSPAIVRSGRGAAQSTGRGGRRDGGLEKLGA